LTHELALTVWFILLLKLDLTLTMIWVG